MSLNRREFLAAAAASAACLMCPGPPAKAAGGMDIARGLRGRKLSPFYQPLDDGRVRCTLCPHGCLVGPGQRGACGVRINEGGRYYSLVYGNPCAAHLDPIEKKPFFHVLPATSSFSLATAGCNFHCRFCQNWEISQKGPEETYNLRLEPEQAAAQARAMGAASIASTYVEPTIFMEYMLDLGAAAHEAGLLKVMHSNGFVNPEPLAGLIKVLDAACIDLKSVRESFYYEVCSGELAPVQDTLRSLVKAGVHTEIVHLMIPTLNDDPAETRDLIRFVRDELSPEVPLHFTRFYPQYKLMNLPPTPEETLTRAYELAKEMGLKFPYVGNLPGHPGESTYCPECGQRLIHRLGYSLRDNRLAQGKCPSCGRMIPGIWQPPAGA
jgi:pyruvate formate lyase activating enzyme